LKAEEEEEEEEEGGGGGEGSGTVPQVILSEKPAQRVFFFCFDPFLPVHSGLLEGFTPFFSPH